MKKTPLRRKTPLRAKGGSRFPKRRPDDIYRAWIRERPCLVRGILRTPCMGVIQAAHVQSRGAGGIDRANLIPLCVAHHGEQHAIGVKSFDAKYGINGKRNAQYLWKVYTEGGTG